MSKDKTFKTFRFPVSKAPEKIDREIREWAEKNGMKLNAFINKLLENSLLEDKMLEDNL